jgi:hypothetical protein
MQIIMEDEEAISLIVAQFIEKCFKSYISPMPSAPAPSVAPFSVPTQPASRIPWTPASANCGAAAPSTFAPTRKQIDAFFEPASFRPASPCSASSQVIPQTPYANDGAQMQSVPTASGHSTFVPTRQQVDEFMAGRNVQAPNRRTSRQFGSRSRTSSSSFPAAQRGNRFGTPRRRGASSDFAVVDRDRNVIPMVAPRNQGANQGPNANINRGFTPLMNPTQNRAPWNPPAPSMTPAHVPNSAVSKPVATRQVQKKLTDMLAPAPVAPQIVKTFVAEEEVSATINLETIRRNLLTKKDEGTRNMIGVVDAMNEFGMSFAFFQRDGAIYVMDQQYDWLI